MIDTAFPATSEAWCTRRASAICRIARRPLSLRHRDVEITFLDVMTLGVGAERQGIEGPLRGHAPRRMVDVGKELVAVHRPGAAILRACGSLIVAVDKRRHLRGAGLDGVHRL